MQTESDDRQTVKVAPLYKQFMTPGEQSYRNNFKYETYIILYRATSHYAH